MIKLDKPSLPFHCVKYELKEIGSEEIVRTTAGKVFPWPIHDFLAESMCRWLNRQIAHDGSWRVVWKEPVKQKYDPALGLFLPHVPTIMECHWLDKDKDPICRVYIDDRLEIMENNILGYVEACEEAWQKTHDFLYKKLDLRPSETFKAALGEKPQSLHI